MSPKSHFLLVGLTVWFWVAPQGRGQEPLTAADSEKVERFLAGGRSRAHLPCSIQPRHPFLDFSFRFNVGYVFNCPLLAFGGRESVVSAFTRVTPEGGKTVSLGETYRLPGAPQVEGAAVNRKLRARAQASGGFAAGEGQYEVDVLLVDRATKRIFRKQWRVRVARTHGQHAVPEAIPPGTVLPLAFRPWQVKFDTSGKGLRLAIWLDAAAMNPRAQKLRVWDRTFLLASLSSLLNQVPCASVHLVAFNLDQQREVFRQDEFDRAGFIRLEEALRSLELGTVSYRVLQQRQGWLDMLLDLANRELTAQEPSDVVIILGPRTHYFVDVGRDRVKTRETASPRFCYFQFFPRPGYPDTLHSLTRRLDGNVYEIYSPGDFARAIQKMLAQVQASRRSSVETR